MTVVSGLIAQGFTIAGGTAVVNGARVEIADDLFLNGYLDVHTSTLVLSGTIPQSLSGSGGAGISALAALYLQNASTMTIPGLTIGVVVANTAANATTVRVKIGGAMTNQNMFIG